MNTLYHILSTPWFGSVLGIIGVVLAVYFYVRGKRTPRIAYQQGGVRLIGGGKAVLPADVTVQFRGLAVPRVTKSIVVLWNAGNTTIRGSDIVDGDPIRICLLGDPQILEARVTQFHRAANSLSVNYLKQPAGSASVAFDFLDPGDGGRIEVLHTGESTGALVSGTIRGVPEGCVDWGLIPRDDRALRENDTASDFSARILARVVGDRAFISWLTIIVGLAAVFVGLFPDLILSISPLLSEPNPKPLLTPGRVNWAIVLVGLLYTVPGASLMWKTRRRYPKHLSFRTREMLRGSKPSSGDDESLSG